MFFVLSSYTDAKIVFIYRSPDGWLDRDVYVMDDDGSNLRQLTTTPRPERDPTWSPNGRLIVYTSPPAEGEDATLFMMNPDGSNQRRVSEKIPRAASPVFLPNDTQNVTFWTTADEEEKEHFRGVINIATGNIKKLFDGIIDHPDWSPDGQQIVYSDIDDLFLMDTVGRNQRRLLPLPPILENTAHKRVDAKWSPDGNYIAYEEDILNVNPFFPRESYIQLYDTRANTSKPLPLPDDWDMYNVIWMDNDTLLICAQPDGLKLRSDEGSNIYRYHMPTDTITQLTDLPGSEFSIAWHPGPLDVAPKEKKTTLWGKIKNKP